MAIKKPRELRLMTRERKETPCENPSLGFQREYAPFHIPSLTSLDSEKERTRTYDRCARSKLLHYGVTEFLPLSLYLNLRFTALNESNETEDLLL